jgi:DNA helicase-2/ATP-dependent DNA helicase PcrA
MYGFCSGDEVKDFNDTLTKLLQSDEEHFKSLFYTANRFDGKFYETFCAYAGLIVSAYNEQLLQSNKVDFDDLIIKSLEYFSDDGVVREWRSLYDYIIVDEMQDTSDLEYSLISKLFAGNKVLMCGDMSQTIYEWRGSKPFEIYEDFCDNYGAKVFMLSRNYRSTDTLTFASFAFLKGINGGSFKRFCPQQITACGGEKGEPIRVVSLKSAMDEASWVFRYIKKHPPEGYDKLCIMSRSNGYISKFYKSLQRVNEKYPEGERLNFFTVDRDCRFYKMPIIKDMLSFFSLLVNPSDFENFERIAKRHIHGVGSVTLSALSEYRNVGVSLSAFLESDTYLCGDRYQSLINSLGHNNVVVYDIETTGLDRGYDQIIQLAAVKIDENGRVLKRFERKVVPTVAIGEGAERTHGFTLEMLNVEGTTIDVALTEFLEFCKGACLVGHNSTNFDRIVVDRQLLENNLPQLDVVGEYDTLSICKLFCPDFENYKLDTLCKKFGIVNERAHDAFYDVLATVGVLVHMVRNYILPTTDARVKILDRYKKKFKSFYDTFLQMKGLVLKNKIEELADFIEGEFSLLKLYDRVEDKVAYSDLMNVISSYRERILGGENLLVTLICEASLSGSQIDFLIKKLNKIPIITVHQSKGCEFDTVIIVGCDSYNFPSFSAVKSGNGSEEERVFYVAITRAKKRLVITNYSDGEGRDLSPFIDRLPCEFVEKYNF